MAMNDVRAATSGELPPPLLDFFNSLDQRRSPHIPGLSALLDTTFHDYFQYPADSNEAEMTTESEIGQYLHILSSSEILNEHNFRANKEGQIDAVFLHDLAGQFRRLANKVEAKAGFRTDWPFSLVAEPQSGNVQRLRKFPHCILEVVSSTRSSLEASCLARLGNRLRDANQSDPVVIMAIFIDSNLQAHNIWFCTMKPSMI
ncbi:hypothetical protein B0F90DRAFT_1743468 [Multifurca ochricompacta]|uniref:Uncharacterized protein n=1 Tax=Multifurca ochricompacta TaxID=376703 RepID=A0AAD4M0G5_9AGAM|nr:hypothetical protein B0F90DRAFT_1743468 [Multifurca ochricompacta]